MKKTIPRALLYTFALAVCLALCLLFGRVLFLYTVPMQDSSYDLSLIPEDGAMEQDWIYDQKGWSVFTQEGEQITPLTADGTGGFTGLQKPGQTFYYSRALTETLDTPTLRLDTANRSVAVFLDGELLYTDFPELDNHIGYLSLPMLDWDRSDPVVVSLPPDYQGRTLTIAQSTGLGEKQEPEADSAVWLCSVQLYCGYSYESGLIAESFQTAIPAALCFGAGVLLLAAFLWLLYSGKADWSLPFLSLTAFLWSAWHIAMSSFTYLYFGTLPFDAAGLSRLLSLTVLLLFLAGRLSGKRRILCCILACLQGAAVLLYAVPGIDQRLGFLWQSIPEWLGLLGLLGSLGCLAWEWKMGSSFARFFCPLAALGLSGLLVWTLAVPSLRQEMGQQLSLGAQGYFLWKLMAILMAAAILSALLESVVLGEINRRAETKILAQQYALAQSGFENLRRHQEEVMMLRHDMTKHLTFLLQSTSDRATASYLEELIGQQQNISPVVQLRNKTLDILLNAKLGEAAGKGIAIEVVQSDAPESLPLTDAELCALMMNLLDNAIHAASLAKEPFLRLDLHQKDGFFVFVCENAADNPPQKSAEKETVPQHGLGLKIIEQIVKRHGDLMEVEQLSGSYRVTIAILLNQSRR